MKQQLQPRPADWSRRDAELHRNAAEQRHLDDTASTVVSLLARVISVRRAGVDRWAAQCPLCCLRRRALTIRRYPDGVITLHCRTGCGATNIMQVFDLSLADLFPAGPLDHHVPPREVRHV